MNTRRHIPALDGIRGLAIILVLLVHIKAAWPATGWLDGMMIAPLRGGWVGVDLFFALSGFLITGILLDSRQQSAGRYFGGFAWRRACRIFPLYYAFLFTLFFVIPRLGVIHDPAYQTLLDNQSWYWLYGVNWLSGLHGGSEVPFQTAHLWSLAVEEQFYLVWPVVVWLAGPRRLPTVCMSLWALSLAGRIVAVATGHADGVYVLTPYRLDPLMAGALGAWAVRHVEFQKFQRRILPAIFWIGGGVVAVWIAGGSFVYSHAMVVTAGLALLAVVFGALVTLAGSGNARVTALADRSVLRFFGKYSYAIYVFHYPLMMVIDRLYLFDRLPPIAGSQLHVVALYAVLVTTISVGMALVSWRLLEHPMIRLRYVLESQAAIGKTVTAR